MKKIECHISDQTNDIIEKLCENFNWNKSEFNRRAIEEFIKKVFSQDEINNKIREFVKKDV